MAETPTTIRLVPGGPEIQGMIVPVTQTLRGEAQVYQLEDGTKITLTVVPGRVVRIEDYNDQDEPRYFVQSQIVVSSDVPPSLRKKS